MGPSVAARKCPRHSRSYAVASPTPPRPRCHNELLRRELTRDWTVGDAVAVEGTEPDLAIYRDCRRGTGVRRGRRETRELADDERLRVDGLGRKAAGTRRAGGKRWGGEA